MKNNISLGAIIVTALLFTKCDTDEFLDKSPQGVLNFDVLSTEDGIDALLIGAYAALDGWIGFGAGDNAFAWYSAASNWLYGDVPSDDSHKGSDAGDEAHLNDIERYVTTPDNIALNTKWKAVYDGIARCNDVLHAVQIARTNGDVSETFLNMKEAEARFLRGHYHFEVKKVFNQIPYITEDLVDTRVPNTQDAWPMIEADLEAARSVLPTQQDQIGRATWGAATALLAKAKMYQNKPIEAKPLLDELINSGIYALSPNFHEPFDIDYDNNEEAIFQVQNSASDGTPENDNGNHGDQLNYPAGAGYTCCSFNQPSQNLVNAFKTENGLPMLDNFNDVDVVNDLGLTAADPFTEHTGPLDPRLDWTVGRRGIPYLGYGNHPGAEWTFDQSFAGPYHPKKNAFRADQEGSLSGTGPAGWHPANNANNTNLIRYADVLLWRAEVAVEENDLNTALVLVNQVRQRAKTSRVVTEEDGVTPAATYVVELYTIFPDQDFARKAVRFERRIELALEGHRFFDLIRWGIAESILNQYVAAESQLLPMLTGANFQSGKNEYWPIPTEQIDLSVVGGSPVLVQNPGY